MPSRTPRAVPRRLPAGAPGSRCRWSGNSSTRISLSFSLLSRTLYPFPFPFRSRPRCLTARNPRRWTGPSLHSSTRRALWRTMMRRASGSSVPRCRFGLRRFSHSLISARCFCTPLADPISLSRYRRKVDLRLLPIISALYSVSLIDRSSEFRRVFELPQNEALMLATTRRYLCCSDCWDGNRSAPLCLEPLLVSRGRAARTFESNADASSDRAKHYHSRLLRPLRRLRAAVSWCVPMATLPRLSFRLLPLQLQPSHPQDRCQESPCRDWCSLGSCCARQCASFGARGGPRLRLT